MTGRIAAFVAAAVAAASAAGAAVWAKRKAAEDVGLENEIMETPEAAAAEAPAEAPGAEEAPGTGAEGDDLTLLKGIGAVSAERLKANGVTTIAQIASWSEEDIDAISAEIKVSTERIRHEDWVGQARNASES